MRTHLLIVSLVFAVALPVAAQELYVPASAHAPGVGTTQWRTDLEVKAAGEDDAVFTVELLERGAENGDPLSVEFSVASGRSVRLVDVVGDVFSFSGAAALRITATSGKILVTSRTYNDDPEGTYGQFIPAFAAGDAAEEGFDYTLMQLAMTDGFRTNLGLVNAGAVAITVEIDLWTSDGVLLGSLTRDLRGYEYIQVTEVFDAVSGEVDEGYAIVRTRTEDARFFAYASVVDNDSGDAIFIPAQLEGPSREVELAPRFVVFEAFMRDG